MGLLSFFKTIFKRQKSQSWNRSPEQFLAMVIYLQTYGGKSYSIEEVLKLGDIMMKVMQVDLFPYKDFADLVANGIPDYEAVNTVKSKMTEVQGRIELKKAIYGEDVDLGDDDVMKSNSPDAIASRNMVDELSKFIKFQEEDKSREE